MCLGGFQGLLSKTQDEVWNFFEKLSWDTYHFEQVRVCSFERLQRAVSG